MASPTGLDGLINSNDQTESQRQMKQRWSGLRTEDRRRKKDKREMVLLLLLFECHVAVTCSSRSAFFSVLYIK